MSTPKTTIQSGVNAAILSPPPKGSPMQNEDVIEKCRKLLTIKGDDSRVPVKSMVESFDKMFMGFIIGQRRSSLQKNVTTRRVRPTPVGKPQSELPIQDIETPVAQLVKSPTKSLTGETVEASKVVLMTPSMAESFAKSVEKKDGQMGSVVRSLPLESDSSSITVRDAQTSTSETSGTKDATVQAEISASGVELLKETSSEVRVDSSSHESVPAALGLKPVSPAKISPASGGSTVSGKSDPDGNLEEII